MCLRKPFLNASVGNFVKRTFRVPLCCRAEGALQQFLIATWNQVVSAPQLQVPERASSGADKPVILGAMRLWRGVVARRDPWTQLALWP